MVITLIWDHEDPQIDSHQEEIRSQQEDSILRFCKNEVLTKESKSFLTTCIIIPQRHEESDPQPLYHWSAGDTTMWPVCCVVGMSRSNFVNIEATDYQSNFAKTILFENCSCVSRIPFSISVESPRIFQCLISIPAGHWVRQIDGKPSAIYLADSFCQL